MVRYAFFERHRTVWPVATQCRALYVSASGDHQYRTRHRDVGSLQPVAASAIWFWWFL
jgi:hypothetical protein